MTAAVDQAVARLLAAAEHLTGAHDLRDEVEALAAAWQAKATPNPECERCAGSGCDLTMCEDCGEEFTDPCARHRAHGHVPAPGGGYDDGTACSSCCLSCFPDLVALPRDVALALSKGLHRDRRGLESPTPLELLDQALGLTPQEMIRP